jgi:Second Messenger Oligonucleotide or Dinucleotide Synthetase domain
VPYHVDTAFHDFYELINLPGDFRETANARKDWIVNRLNPVYNILDAFAMGSIPKYTALQEHADLDVMVVLHFGEHIEGKTPADVLEDLRTMLGSGAGSVRRNGQAVTMRFQSWPNVDVVPASVRYADKETKKIDYYSIPDMHRSEWLRTRPRNHAKAIASAAELNGPKFRQVIKMIKEWNRRQRVQLQSYHIEVIALKMESAFDDYSWAVYQWFETAKEHVWVCFHEGVDIVEYLDGKYTTVLDQLKDAEKLANDAWYLTYADQDDHEQAIAKWRKVFGQSFPPYG